MIKHICIMAGKRGGGSYGLGDTQAEAEKIAKSMMGGDPVRVKRYRTVEVGPGERVEFHALPTGVEWHVVLDVKPQPPTEKPMRHYRVPYLVYGPTARNKATLASGMTADRLKNPDVQWIEFDAPTHAAAQRQLQDLILPDDDRKIRGRNYVSLFMMERELTPAEVANVEAMVDAIKSM
jgi:hypothetical protein